MICRPRMRYCQAGGMLRIAYVDSATFGRNPAVGLAATRSARSNKQVAEVGKALYHRTDEPAVPMSRAIARDAWSAPPMAPLDAGVLLRISCTLSGEDVYSRWTGGCLQ